MLTGDQVEALSLRAEEISDKLSDFLIKDIAERVSEAGQLTSTASYEVWRFQNLGVSQEKLKKELKKRLNISLSQVEDLLKQSAEAGYNFDISNFPTDKAIPFAENTTLQQIVGASVQMAQEDFTNIVQTIGFVGPEGNVQELTQAYQGACDYAFQKTVTGTQDMQSAIREATKNLAEKGIRYIDYESGVHTSMEAAVRRCVMGGMGLMQEKISESNHDYLGCDGWEISAHHDSAPDHEPIQGKQYTDKEYKTINGSLLRRIGTLNCGHAAFPIIMGVNSPQYTAKQLEDMRKENEEGVTYGDRHYTLYEATQRQRQYERTIRKQKRRILVDESTGDKDRLQNDQIRLQLLKQEYAKFSRGTGLRPQYDRMETAGFDWKKGRAAERAFTQHNELKKLRDPARFRDVVTIMPPYKGDAITHRSLYNNLAKSEIGREAIDYISSGKCMLEISYTDDAPKGIRGETFGHSITIYAKNTRTIKLTAKTIIHEVTHSKYKIGGSQWAEAVCFSMEHIHEHGQLTFQDKRNIIKTVKDLYPEYQWRKGGRNNWKKK